MQLRIARLCLDCEELHSGESCPVCASDRFIFLSTWLPSEERRRWGRQAPPPAQAPRIHPIRSWINRLMGLPDPQPAGPRTRASDRRPHLDFDKRKESPDTPAPEESGVRADR
jgi:hypothetical protein